MTGNLRAGTRLALALCRQDFRVMRRDPVPLVLFIGMPIVVLPFVISAFRPALFLAGYRGATGGEQALPGVALTFGFFTVSLVAFTFFREHGWGTWDRIRLNARARWPILLGKTIPVAALVLVQQLLIVGLGTLVMGFARMPNWLVVVPVVLAYSAFCIALGTALVAILNTFQQLNALTNLGALALSALSGALIPIEVLPKWSRAVSPALPTYWAMKALRTAFLSPSQAMKPAFVASAVLIGATAVAGAVAWWRLNFSEAKTPWS